MFIGRQSVYLSHCLSERISHWLVHSPIPATARAHPGHSQELRTWSGFPMWVAGAQLLQPRSAASQGFQTQIQAPPCDWRVSRHAHQREVSSHPGQVLCSEQAVHEPHQMCQAAAPKGEHTEAPSSPWHQVDQNVCGCFRERSCGI